MKTNLTPAPIDEKNVCGSGVVYGYAEDIPDCYEDTCNDDDYERVYTEDYGELWIKKAAFSYEEVA